MRADDSRGMLAIVALTATLTGAAAAAQQAEPAARAPQPKPLVPVAASTLVRNPQPYIGLGVTVTGSVARVLGGSTFTLAQNRTDGSTGDVLVVAPVLTAALAPRSYVTVIGEVVAFDAARVAERMKNVALPEGVAERYRGKPAVLATSVITSSLTDIARIPPPPLTPEEQSLQQSMKAIGAAFATLRLADPAKAREDAEAAGTLAKTFADVEAFWKTRSRPDAVQWTADARKAADSLAAAIGAGQWEAVKGGVPTLQQACQSCHAAYRERLDDGSYRLKK